MCTVLLPPGVIPVAVNKYIISYKPIYIPLSGIIAVLISSRLIWVGRGEGVGEDKYMAVVWRGNLKERYYFEDLAIDWRIILK